MKIFFFPGEYPFCYYFRGYLPGVYGNHMVVKDFLMLRKDSPLEAIQEQARKADVVVMQRPKDPPAVNLARVLKRMGKKIIFENDDSYEVGKAINLGRLQNDKQREVVKMFDNNLKEVLRMADGAIASTEALAEEYRKINPNVAVVKNCIDPLDAQKCKPNTTGKFRIGLIGSVTTNDDYLHIKKALRELDDRGDVTIVVLGVKYKDGSHNSFMDEDYLFWGSLKNMEWHPYVSVTEYMPYIADLALDLAIIPRIESYFNKCKSNLKFLEMSLLEIPVLAQGFSNKDGPYDDPKDQKYMEVVYNNDTWYEHIITIKENYKLYKKKAKQAKKYVLKHYNIETYHPVWTKTIQKLCK